MGGDTKTHRQQGDHINVHKIFREVSERQQRSLLLFFEYKEIKLNMHVLMFVTRKLHMFQKKLTPIKRNRIVKMNFSINSITTFHST
jgi:hypothetical protein